ncbi:hypothetical protein BDZ97DRAFT_1919994 [Flammula alnicola]|nr:hypothetical protein BDZ97DRAFT_1919994 [Flammula alnicola]
MRTEWAQTMNLKTLYPFKRIYDAYCRIRTHIRLTKDRARPLLERRKSPIHFRRWKCSLGRSLRSGKRHSRDRPPPPSTTRAKSLFTRLRLWKRTVGRSLTVRGLRRRSTRSAPGTVLSNAPDSSILEITPETLELSSPQDDDTPTQDTLMLSVANIPSASAIPLPASSQAVFPVSLTNNQHTSNPPAESNHSSAVVGADDQLDDEAMTDEPDTSRSNEVVPEQLHPSLAEESATLTSSSNDVPPPAHIFTYEIAPAEDVEVTSWTDVSAPPPCRPSWMVDLPPLTPDTASFSVASVATTQYLPTPEPSPHHDHIQVGGLRSEMDRVQVQPLQLVPSDSTELKTRNVTRYNDEGLNGNSANGHATISDVHPRKPLIDALPNELITSILEYLLPNDTLTPTHRHLINVRGVSNRWKALSQQLLFQSGSLILSPSLSTTAEFNPSHRDLRSKWHAQLRHVIKTRGHFDTVAFCFDSRSSPDEDLASLFTGALSKCRRSAIVRLLPESEHDLQDPMHFEFPRLNFRQDLRWSRLTELRLDCPLSDSDAYDILTLGSQTLETVALTVRKSGSLEEDIPNIQCLDHLHSLEINSWVELMTLFSRLSLPSLTNLSLGARTESALLTPSAASSLLDPELNIPWSRLTRLSLRSHSYRPCSLDRILSKCNQLSRFEWQGGLREFASSDTLPPTALPRLQELTLLSDEAGACESLLELLSHVPNVQVIKISRYSRHVLWFLERHYTKLVNLAIDERITLHTLASILRSVGQTLVRGEFVTGDIDGQPLMGDISCLSLKHLTLRSSVSLRSFWERIDKLPLQTLTIILQNGISSPEIEPFLSRFITPVAPPIIGELRQTQSVSYHYLFPQSTPTQSP